MFFWRPPSLTILIPGPDTSAARRESVERAEGAPSRSAEGAPSMAMSADRRECAEVNKAISKKHAQRYARSDMSTGFMVTSGVG